MNTQYQEDMGAPERAFTAVFRGNLFGEHATQSFLPSPSMVLLTLSVSSSILRNMWCSKCLHDPENVHLLLHNLQEFDAPYLHVLLADDDGWYLHIENHAKSLGIGPLAPWTFAAFPKEQQANCSVSWYSFANLSKVQNIIQYLCSK
ncbi:hypothetical protein V8E55_007194 [Tylopilus felleus]